MVELAHQKINSRSLGVGYSITKKPEALVVIFLFLALMVMSSIESLGVYDIQNFLSLSSLHDKVNYSSIFVEEEIEDEYESCLRPRRNSDAVERSPPQPPCELN